LRDAGQAASVNSILREARLTKGAFFHHFSTEMDFGYALVDEVLAGMIAARWVGPLRTAGDPLETIATEMNPLDDGFRSRTSSVFSMCVGHDHRGAAGAGASRTWGVGVDAGRRSAQFRCHPQEAK
jgi:AcrR family transcriptional regulator